MKETRTTIRSRRHISRDWKKWMYVFPCIGMFVLSQVCMAGPEVDAVETFDVDVSGWEDRDSGEMTVAFDALGNPGGAISGLSSNQVVPVPETDAIRSGAAASVGVFTGDYAHVFGHIAGWSFDFNARDMLPSSAILRFGRDTNIIFQSFTSQITGTNSWEPVFLRLDTVDGWLGGGSSVYTNVLGGVEFIDFQITRSGHKEQRYALDNFRLLELIPVAGGQLHANTNLVRVFWSELKTGFDYFVQAETNILFGTNWTDIGIFMATNVVTEWTMPYETNKPLQYFRLRIEEFELD